MLRACPVCQGTHHGGERCPDWTAKVDGIRRIQPRASGWGRGGRRPVSRESRAFKSHLMRELGECGACRSTVNLELDHVVPLADGGEDALDNCQLLCRRCHGRKSRAEAKARRERRVAESFARAPEVRANPDA